MLRSFPVRRSLIPGTLLAAVWLVLVDNGSFWQLILDVSAGWDQPAPWFAASIFIVSVALVNLVLTLLTFGRTARYILFALLCLSAAAGYFMSQYGVMLDEGMLGNILETDRAEAMELISARLFLTVVLLGAVPGVLIWRLLPAGQRWSRILAEKAAVVGVTLLVLAVTVTPFYKDYASLARNHREIRHLLNPINYLQSVYVLAANGLSTPAVAMSVGEDARKGVRWAGLTHKTLTVLVIGETARADNFSLGGYQRNTNPRLANVPVTYFSNVEACGTATRVSLPCMFSDLNRSNYSKSAAKYREGLLDVIQHAGIRTLWLDNNAGCKGVCSQATTRQITASDVSGRCVDGECFDEVLLDELRKEIGAIEEDTVIVLHQNGSHGPSYYRRYPEKFRKFTPDCRSDEFSDCTREEIINSYDNTIYYTDYFLGQIVDLLEKASDKLDTAMLYVSDHGESLGEYGLYLHGTPYFVAPEYQTHVPMLSWMSSAYQHEFGIDRDCLDHRHAVQLSHDHLFHSVLGLMNISTSVYDSELDLFAACASRQSPARQAAL